MALECTICDHRSQKISGGGPPDPLKEDVSFVINLTNMCIHNRARHYTLSDFLVKTHFDPWWRSIFKNTPFLLESMDHASSQKSPRFCMQMQTSIHSPFGLDCRDRGFNYYFVLFINFRNSANYFIKRATWALLILLLSRMSWNYRESRYFWIENRT